MNKHGQSTFEELYKLFPDASDAEILTLFEVLNSDVLQFVEIPDYGFECNMCGKPMSYRYCGLCWNCEAEWNG